MAGEGQATTALANPKKLGLAGLLHYLWAEAELTKWVPAMEGKRWWGPVERALKEALVQKAAKGRELSQVMYVPEAFKVDRSAAHKARQEAFLGQLTVPGQTVPWKTAAPSPAR